MIRAVKTELRRLDFAVRTSPVLSMAAGESRAARANQFFFLAVPLKPRLAPSKADALNFLTGGAPPNGVEDIVNRGVIGCVVRASDLASGSAFKADLSLIVDGRCEGYLGERTLRAEDCVLSKAAAIDANGRLFPMREVSSALAALYGFGKLPPDGPGPWFPPSP
jgi:hypothetical protein